MRALHTNGRYVSKMGKYTNVSKISPHVTLATTFFNLDHWVGNGERNKPPKKRLDAAQVDEASIVLCYINLFKLSA